MKKILKYMIAFIILTVFFLSSLLISSALPEKRIKNNIKDSVKYIEREGTYPRIFSTNDNAQLDNWTDSMMLNTAYYLDSNSNPLKSILETSFYKESNYRETGTRPKDWLNTITSDKVEPNATYSRYWHGYLVILRPLLSIFDLSEIRIFNTYAFYILLITSLFIIYKKCGKRVAFAYLITVIMLNITIIPMSMQFMTMFVITFISVIMAAIFNEKKPKLIPLVFFIIGSVTMFFDFYTYPVLSFGIPISIVLIMNANKDNNISFKSLIKIALLCFALWMLGYILTWLIKVALVAIALDQSEVLKSFESIKSRLARSGEGLKVKENLWINSIILNIKQICSKPSIIFSGIILISWLPLFVFFKKPNHKLHLSLILLIISLIPLAWFSVAANPSIIHYWFQYRTIGVTIFGIICALLLSIDIERIRCFYKKH